MIDNVRWKNTDDLMKYLSAGEIIEEREELSREEQMEEFMILGLRMTEGVSRKDFLDCFGQDPDHTFEGVIPKLRSMNLISTDGDRIRLTDRGLDVSNTVLAEFLFQ